ncbi:MAG: hypothetical protein NTY01_19540 [Verrucomicrobia bacterium]|nr:hypothetical protein [Verrucomicrobiota bacterium]
MARRLPCRRRPGQPSRGAASSTPGEVLRTPGFYLLWAIYFIGAWAGWCCRACSRR